METDQLIRIHSFAFNLRSCQNLVVFAQQYRVKQFNLIVCVELFFFMCVHIIYLKNREKLLSMQRVNLLLFLLEIHNLGDVQDHQQAFYCSLLSHYPVCMLDNFVCTLLSSAKCHT